MTRHTYRKPGVPVAERAAEWRRYRGPSLRASLDVLTIGGFEPPAFGYQPMLYTTGPSMSLAQYYMLVGHGSVLSADMLGGGGGM